MTGAAGEVCPDEAGPVVLRAEADVAADGKVPERAGERLAVADGWTDAELAGDRPTAKAQRFLNRASGRGCDNEPGQAIRGRRAGQGGPPVAPYADDRGRTRREGPEEARFLYRRSKAAAHGLRGRVANGINTVHLVYVGEETGHALVRLVARLNRTILSPARH
jgi:hypothetical protein